VSLQHHPTIQVFSAGSANNHDPLVAIDIFLLAPIRRTRPRPGGRVRPRRYARGPCRRSKTSVPAPIVWLFRPTGQVCTEKVEVGPHGAKWSRGRASHCPISPIESGPRPIVTAQGRNCGRMPSRATIPGGWRESSGESGVKGARRIDGPFCTGWGD
jgi:hypothetical protein